MIVFSLRGNILLLAILAWFTDVGGQTIKNVGGKIDNIGGSYSNPFVSTIPINDTDLIVVVSGVFSSGSVVIRWNWYRNQLNSDFKTFTTLLVTNMTRNYSMVAQVALQTTRNSNFVMIVYMNTGIYAHPIELINPTFNYGNVLLSPGKDFDTSMAAMSHSHPDYDRFSVVYGVRNTTHTCIYRSLFDQNDGVTPRTIFCPFSTTSNYTYLQAWSDPIDGEIFYVTSAYPNNMYYTYKCTGATDIENKVSCIPVTQVNLSQAITQSYGRLAPNSGVFFYAGTSDGNPVQIIAVDFVGNSSTSVTVPISSAGTRIIALVDSTFQDAVTMLTYDASIPGFQVIDLLFNSATKNVTYNSLGTFTSANMFTISGVNIPASSLGPSVFAIGTASTDTTSQVSTQFFGRQFCGDGFVFLNEECDSVTYCDTITCKCTYGTNGTNMCKELNTPGTAPIGTSPETVIPTANQNNETGARQPRGPATETGAPIEVIVPSIIIPVVVVAVGIVVLVVLLRRRKKKSKMKSTEASASSTDERMSPKSVRLMLEPVHYFGVPLGAAPELGKDSNTATGSEKTVHSPIDGLDVTLNAIASSTKQENDLRLPDDRMKIPYSELKFVREIGAGAFGKVFLGEWQKTNVALKISSITSSNEFIREVELIINLRPHPNIVQVLGMSTDGVNVVMIMEFCDGGSLDSLKNPTMKDKNHLLSGIAKGIYHLHKNNIVHRDLAARNILLSRGEPKLSDFGMSRKLQEATAHGTTKTTVGPIRWMAPECLRTAKYSTKSDVWSFGILCWEVLSGEEPHLNSDPLTIGVAIRDQGLTPMINNEWDEALQSLMKECWELEPDLRPDMSDICERLSRLDN